MKQNKPSRRGLILGAAAAATTVPAASLLLPQSVIEAAAAAPQGKGHRGPAHDWLDSFVAKKEYGADRRSKQG